MCYSPEADLVAGFVVGAIGIDAFRRVGDRRDMALAAVPIVLAAHQLIEAVAWRGLQDRAPEAVGNLAVGVYLVIALGIVPMLVPYAVLRTERDSRRRAAMLPLFLLGVGVSFVLLLSLVIAPYGASIGGRYIAYEVSVLGSGLTGAAYAIRCLRAAPALESSSARGVRIRQCAGRSCSRPTALGRVDFSVVCVGGRVESRCCSAREGSV